MKILNMVILILMLLTLNESPIFVYLSQLFVTRNNEVLLLITTHKKIVPDKTHIMKS